MRTKESSSPTLAWTILPYATSFFMRKAVPPPSIETREQGSGFPRERCGKHRSTKHTSPASAEADERGLCSCCAQARREPALLVRQQQREHSWHPACGCRCRP